MKNASEAQEFLVELFAKAGKFDKKDATDSERFKHLSESGAQTFKRKALGLCGGTTIKSLDEIAGLLVDTNIASSFEEAKELVPKIVQANRLHSHAINRGGLGYMEFEEVNYEGDVKYKITAWEAY